MIPSPPRLPWSIPIFRRLPPSTGSTRILYEEYAPAHDEQSVREVDPLYSFVRKADVVGRGASLELEISGRPSLQ